MFRKVPLATGEIYHIYNRSIARFVILDHPNEQKRFCDLIAYCQSADPAISFTRHLRDPKSVGSRRLNPVHSAKPSVRVVAYCVMPTHFHFALMQLSEGGISAFVKRIENSYSKFFNALHKRKGPLWESRFQSRHIDSDEYLLLLSRYIHLNPVKAGLVQKAEHWAASSYKEYLNPLSEDSISQRDSLITLSPSTYRKFAEDAPDYHSKISKIGHLLLDSESQA